MKHLSFLFLLLFLAENTFARDYAFRQLEESPRHQEWVQVYGGNDQRINATIPETAELMDKYDKFFEYNIYDGAGHGYMRTGDDPEGSEENVTTRNQSWEWIMEILISL